MSKKITTIYERKWERRALRSLLAYARDCLVSIYPFRRLPKKILERLYGEKISFVFFVHPRRREDIFIALPFLRFLSYLVPLRIFSKVLAILPPFVLEKIKTDNGIEGGVVSSLTLPEWLLTNRRGSFRAAKQGLRFSSKIMRGKYLGLGGLWPLVTRRGLALRSVAKGSGIHITNGHTGTVLSLYWMVQKIASLASLPMNRFSIAIIGVGKIGANIARVFVSSVQRITLIDINDTRLQVVKEDLMRRNGNITVDIINSKRSSSDITKLLSFNHLAICTTSNVERILKPVQIPQDFIMIDDSRPEAIPRVLDSESKLVLEGGLLKIKGMKLSYDYGFGVDENVFGCLAETYLLALDDGLELVPSLGEIQSENFYKMMKFCEVHRVEIGSFKSSARNVDPEKIKRIIKERDNFISSTGLAPLAEKGNAPFRN